MGTFYGTAAYDGKYPNFGTVFKITPSGELTTLHNFNSKLGSYPYAGSGSGHQWGILRGNLRWRLQQCLLVWLWHGLRSVHGSGTVCRNAAQLWQGGSGH